MLKPRVTIVLDEPCVALRDELEAIGPVFVFKRKGGFLATSAVDAAEELHEALKAARVAPPHVLVAASFGGFAALAYAARHPATLAGLVLVDSSHPNQGAAALAAIPDTEPPTEAVVKFKHSLQGFGPVWSGSCRDIAQITSLADLPMIVLAAGNPDMPAELSDGTRQALTQSWHTLQRQHTALSSRGKLRIVPRCGHNIVATAPEVIVAAVRDLATQDNL